MMKCKKCDSTEFMTENRGPHVGIYCAECGAFLKWGTPEEVRLINNIKWILVSDRLPSSYETVLVTVKRRDDDWNQAPYLRLAYHFNNDWYPVPQSINNVAFPDNLAKYDGGDPVVLAWMPVPLPYESEAK